MWWACKMFAVLTCTIDYRLPCTTQSSSVVSGFPCTVLFTFGYVRYCIRSLRLCRIFASCWSISVVMATSRLTDSTRNGNMLCINCSSKSCKFVKVWNSNTSLKERATRSFESSSVYSWACPLSLPSSSSLFLPSLLSYQSSTHTLPSHPALPLSTNSPHAPPLSLRRTFLMRTSV